MRGKPTSSFFPLNPSFCLCGTLHGFTAMCNALSLISLPHHLIFSHLHPFPPCLCPNEALAQPQWDGSAACHGSPQPHSECAHQGGIGTPQKHQEWMSLLSSQMLPASSSSEEVGREGGGCGGDCSVEVHFCTSQLHFFPRFLIFAFTSHTGSKSAAKCCMKDPWGGWAGWLFREVSVTDAVLAAVIQCLYTAHCRYVCLPVAWNKSAICCVFVSAAGGILILSRPM